MSGAMTCSACKLPACAFDLESSEQGICYACRALAGEFGRDKQLRARRFQGMRERAAAAILIEQADTQADTQADALPTPEPVTP